MNREQFKQRMKSLKSYREQNPDKGYWDWKIEQFQDGGDNPPSDYQGSNEPVHVNPFTRRPLANGSITPAFDLEDAVNLTPIGDVLSIRDAYTAAKNRDLLGLGLAGLGFLPFMSRIKPVDRPPIPTVNREAYQNAMNRAVQQSEKNKAVLNDFYTQRDRVYDSLIENENAFRRAASATNSSNSNYIQVYTDMLRNRDNISPTYDYALYPTQIRASVSTSTPNNIKLNPRYKDPNEIDETFQELGSGLIRHEMGHSTDIKAGLDYTDKLADPSKFEPEDRLKSMYPKSYKTIQDYLLKGSEIKSHMNEFRQFLFDNNDYNGKETLNSFRRKLDKYGDRFNNLKAIFNSYKSKKQFIRDYNNIPIVATDRKEDLV